MKCEICKIKKAIYFVDVLSSSEIYRYKKTYRCEECKDCAVRSYEKVKIEKL